MDNDEEWFEIPTRTVYSEDDTESIEDVQPYIDNALVNYLCEDKTLDSSFTDLEVPEPGIYSEPYIRSLIVRTGNLTYGHDPDLWHRYGTELFEEFLEELCYSIKVDTERAKERLSLAFVANERSDFPLERGILDMIAEHLGDKPIPRMRI